MALTDHLVQGLVPLAGKRSPTGGKLSLSKVPGNAIQDLLLQATVRTRACDPGIENGSCQTR
jgi:hypothetical protein